MKDVLKTGQVLGRNEMKKIVAGSMNMYCMMGGEQFHCFGENLTACLDSCVDNEIHTGETCEGCAQF